MTVGIAVVVLVSSGFRRVDARLRESPCLVAIDVMDSIGAPIQSVEVVVTNEANETAASLVTDSSGHAGAHLAAGTYTIAARRFGYRPATAAIRTTCSNGDRRFRIILATLPPTLAAVDVTAREDERRRRLFIDAEAIASSPRRLDDALDIVAKLRPDMAYGLGGKEFCGPAANIWINGRRIPWQLVSINAMAADRDPGLELPSWIKSVLASIKPEHIAQMTYHDCMDLSVGKLGSDRAIFIVLKPGIEYDPGSGSHPVTKP